MLHLDPQSRGEGCPGIFLFFHHHFGEVLAYPLVVGIGQLNACEIIDQRAVDQMMGLGDGHDVSPGNITFFCRYFLEEINHCQSGGKQPGDAGFSGTLFPMLARWLPESRPVPSSF